MINGILSQATGHCIDSECRHISWMNEARSPLPQHQSSVLRLVKLQLLLEMCLLRALSQPLIALTAVCTCCSADWNRSAWCTAVRGRAFSNDIVRSRCRVFPVDSRKDHPWDPWDRQK